MKLLLIYLLQSIVFLSCKKADKPTEMPPGLMVVMEVNSTTPIQGVKVECYTCLGEPDPFFGCISRALFSTGYTDSEGKYNFSEEELRKATDEIVLTKEHYDRAVGGAGNRYMTPIANLNMHLIKQGNYQTTSWFEYSYSIVPDASGQLYGHTYLHTLPVDTTITFRLPGNYTYTINWNIVDPANCTSISCSGPYFNSGSVSNLRPQSYGDTLVTIQY